MPRVCASSGKRTGAGRHYAWRGMAKNKGGIGLKVTGITNRVFKPNLQKIRLLLPNGEVRTVRLAASEIRSGKINLKIGGKLQSVIIRKAPHGIQKKYRENAGRKKVQ